MYLQNMRPSELPQGTFHVARWHNSGKLWISQVTFSSERADIELVITRKNDLIQERGWPAETPYFVWHAGMSDVDLEPYRAESDANKIK